MIETKVLCDRCKKEITSDHYEIRSQRVSLDRQQKSDYKQVDFCLDCMDQFKKFRWER